MNRVSRRTLAGAVAVALTGALTVSVAPPATAAPHAVHVKAVKHAKAAKVTKVKVTKVERKVAQAQRLLTREASHKHAYLGKVLSGTKLAALDSGVAASVRINILNDRADLVALEEDVASATTLPALSELRGQLRAVRPEVYQSVLSQLLVADALQAQALTVGEEAATVLLDQAVSELVTFTARTPKSALQASQGAIAQAAALIAAAVVVVPEPVTPVVPAT